MKRNSCFEIQEVGDPRMKRKRVTCFEKTWARVLADPSTLQEVGDDHSPKAVAAMLKAMLSKDTPRAVFDELERLGLLADHAATVARAALQRQDLAWLSSALSLNIPRFEMYRLLREAFGNDDSTAMIIDHMHGKQWTIGPVNIEAIAHSSMARAIVAATRDPRFSTFNLRSFHIFHGDGVLKVLFETMDVPTMIRMAACGLSLLMVRASSDDILEVLRLMLRRAGDHLDELVEALVFPKEYCTPLPMTRALLRGLDDIVGALIGLYNDHGIVWSRRDKQYGNRTPSLVAVLCASNKRLSLATAKRVILEGGGSLYKDDNLGLNAFGYAFTLKSPVEVIDLVFTACSQDSVDRHIRFGESRDNGPFNSSVAVCLAESDYPFSYCEELPTRISAAAQYMAHLPLFASSIERRHHTGLYPVQLMALNLKQVVPELKTYHSSWSSVLYNLMRVQAWRLPVAFTLEQMRRGVAYLIAAGHVSVEEVAGMASAMMLPFWEPSWGQAPLYGLGESVRQLRLIDCAPQWSAVICLKLAQRFPLEDIVEALQDRRICKELVLPAYCSTYHSNWVKATVGKLFHADDLVLDTIARYVCFGEARLPFKVAADEFAQLAQRIDPLGLGELPNRRQDLVRSPWTPDYLE